MIVSFHGQRISIQTRKLSGPVADDYLYLWTPDCFSKIVSTLGTLMEIDKATLKWEQLEFARLKVRFPIVFKVDSAH